MFRSYTNWPSDRRIIFVTLIHPFGFLRPELQFENIISSDLLDDLPVTKITTKQPRNFDILPIESPHHPIPCTVTLSWNEFWRSSIPHPAISNYQQTLAYVRSCRTLTDEGCLLHRTIETTNTSHDPILVKQPME